MLSWSRAQDPDDIRFRGFDWSQWFSDERTAITQSTVIVDTGTIVVSDEAIAGGITRFKVTGGAHGETAVITNRVLFDNGEQIDQSARLRIRASS